MAAALLALAYRLFPPAFFTLSIEGRLAVAKSRSLTIRLFTLSREERTKSVFGAVSGVVVIGTLPNKVASVLYAYALKNLASALNAFFPAWVIPPNAGFSTLAMMILALLIMR